jgi:hypothetical protein
MTEEATLLAPGERNVKNNFNVTEKFHESIGKISIFNYLYDFMEFE